MVFGGFDSPLAHSQTKEVQNAIIRKVINHINNDSIYNGNNNWVGCFDCCNISVKFLRT